MFIHSPPPPPTKPQPLTIFVHGTQMHALIKDKDIRAYFPADTQTPMGMVTAESLSETHQVRTILQALSTTDPQSFPFEGMYTFGWSGSIEVEERRNAAKALFDLIQSLAQTYELIHHSPPEITLICHSHGGNVALHMAEICQNAAHTIKQTILLACPVQARTAAYSTHPFFNTIYSLHSHDDQVQTLDQESLQQIRTTLNVPDISALKRFQLFIKEMQSNKWKLGSDRHFSVHSQLIQAEVVWHTEPDHSSEYIEQGLSMEINLHTVFHRFSADSRGVLHTEFTTTSFFKQLPSLLASLEDEWMKNGPGILCLKRSIAGS